MIGFYESQRFNFTTRTWTSFTTYPPFETYKSGCVVLSNEEVLFAGSSVESVSHAAAYNPLTNGWRYLPSLNSTQGPCSLVQLGSRFFAVGGQTTTAEEFDPNTNSWSTVTAPQMYLRYGLTESLAVPAELFASRPGGCRGIN